MNDILIGIREGNIAVDEAMEQLRWFPFEDLEFARIDHHRGLRKGFPEVIFGPGKTPEQVVQIAGTLIARSDRVLITRTTPEVYQAVKSHLPDAKYFTLSGLICIDRRAKNPRLPGIVVVSAGTSDQNVVEEVVTTAELCDSEVVQVRDVGVAGIHRLLASLPTLRKARIIVAVAGMEGALPSVISGLVEAPVIGVPTSIGYGTNLSGLTPLMAMLTSCSPGLSVVNIDNGFGAGYLAGMLNRLGFPNLR